MREADRHEQLRQLSADNSTATCRPKVGEERRRSTADIEDAAARDAHQLGLRERRDWKCRPRTCRRRAESE